VGVSLAMDRKVDFGMMLGATQDDDGRSSVRVCHAVRVARNA
jgi:hypothetical protein